MQPLEKRISILQADVAKAMGRLQLDTKQAQLEKTDKELAEPEVWNNPNHAQDLSKQAASLRSQIEPWDTLHAQVRDMIELMELGDSSLEKEFETQILAMEHDFSQLKKDLQFNGPYDDHNVIVRITAGVGGTDAQDFAEMLERMYLRYAEKHDMKVQTVERSTGDIAGLKTSVFEISGAFAYGKLRSENGVHRLVRLSPFNSDNLRQTSFALVEILPKIETPQEVKVDEKD